MKQNPKSEILNPKSRILKALFAEANRLGIDQETLRDDIAPDLIKKRLSQASPQEVARVLEHIHGGNPKSQIRNPKSYESSRRGLLQEVADLARQRYGEDFVKPLNAFCHRFGCEGFRSLKVADMKVIKRRLLELQASDPRI